MSVIPNYLTIREAIDAGVIDFSPRHLKRLIQHNLKDENDYTATYQVIKGIKTIILHINLLKKLIRQRNKKRTHFQIDNSKSTFNLSEITINFKHRFYKKTLQEIIKKYPSKAEFKFVVEGTHCKNHIHMMVQDNTETAKRKIEEILNFNKIELAETNLLIRPIHNSKKFTDYKGKYDAVISHCNSTDSSIYRMEGNENYFSPYGATDFNRESIFDYKRRNKTTKVY